VSHFASRESEIALLQKMGVGVQVNMRRSAA